MLGFFGLVLGDFWAGFATRGRGNAGAGHMVTAAAAMCSALRPSSPFIIVCRRPVFSHVNYCSGSVAFSDVVLPCPLALRWYGGDT